MRIALRFAQGNADFAQGLGAAWLCFGCESAILQLSQASAEANLR
jgi:hypothetical protein